MRQATEFDEGAEEHADRREQQPRPALEQFENAPSDEEGEQRESENGQGEFHWHKHYQFPRAMQVSGGPKMKMARRNSPRRLGFRR